MVDGLTAVLLLLGTLAASVTDFVVSWGYLLHSYTKRVWFSYWRREMSAEF